MKKTLTLIILVSAMLCLPFTLISQNYVSTEPSDKNAILEEFTGVQCSNCPAGHQVAATILLNNPGRAFVVGCHPVNSSYTTPYAGNPDFRRSYLNAFYTTPWCGSSRFMPSSFINRRIWPNGDRLQSRTVWSNYANIIMAEPSPLNVGLSSNYDDLTSTLTVNVEVYYTEDVTQQTNIYVYLSENDLIAQQLGGGVSYVHKHVFRESFNAQWGDPITGPTNQGTLVELEYTFDNSTAQYVMDNCELLAFVIDYDSEEVITGNGADVGEATLIPPTANFSSSDTSFNIGDVIEFTDESLGNPTTWSWEFEGGDPASSTLQTPPPITYNDLGSFSVTLTVSNALGESTELKEDFINVGYAPVTDFSGDPISILEGESVTFTDMTLHDPEEWYWEFEGGDPPSSTNQTPPLITYSDPGSYNVTLTTTNMYGENIMLKEDYIFVGGVGIDEHKSLSNVVLRPNPTRGLLQVDLSMTKRNNCKLEIFSASGELVMSLAVNSPDIEVVTFDLSSKSSGLYYLTLTSSEEKHTTKFILLD